MQFVLCAPNSNFYYAVTYHMTAYSIHQEEQIPEKFCAYLNLWPWTYDTEDIMASLNKHKKAAHDRMLGDLISISVSITGLFLFSIPVILIV